MRGWPTIGRPLQIRNADLEPASLADFNLDGEFDFFDYLDFIAAFSAGR